MLKSSILFYHSSYTLSNLIRQILSYFRREFTTIPKYGNSPFRAIAHLGSCHYGAYQLIINKAALALGARGRGAASSFNPRPLSSRPLRPSGTFAGSSSFAYLHRLNVMPDTVTLSVLMVTLSVLFERTDNAAL
jgi:hypothetical protein